MIENIPQLRIVGGTELITNLSKHLYTNSKSLTPWNVNPILIVIVVAVVVAIIRLIWFVRDFLLLAYIRDIKVLKETKIVSTRTQE